MLKLLPALAAPSLLLGGIMATPATAAVSVASRTSVASPGWTDTSADQYRRGDRYRPGDYYESPRAARARQRRADRRRAERRYEQRRYEQSRYDQRYDNRYRECDRGVGGTAVGAVAGGLLGNEVARRGDKTGGTILGAVLGGVLGNVIDRRDDPCRSRSRGYRR